jgi:hypothetical protein
VLVTGWRSPLFGEGILQRRRSRSAKWSHILTKLCIDAKRCQTTIKLVCAQSSDRFLDLFGRFVPSHPDFEIPRGFAPLAAIDLQLRRPEEFGLLAFEGLRTGGLWSGDATLCRGCSARARALGIRCARPCRLYTLTTSVVR